MRASSPIGWKDRGLQLATASCYVAVAVLAAVPAQLRPHVPAASDKIEHILAFLVLGALTTIAGTRRMSARRLVGVLVAYAVILELGQMFIPGRDASVMDMAASSAGAILGVTLALWIDHSSMRHKHVRFAVSGGDDERS